MHGQKHRHSLFNLSGKMTPFFSPNFKKCDTLKNKKNNLVQFSPSNMPLFLEALDKLVFPNQFI